MHQIQSVRLQAWGENYVQAVTFIGGETGKDTLAQLKTQKGKGEVSEYLVDQGYKVVGVYGYLD